MHITQETDYAIRIVYCLANADGRKDARAISEEMGVTLRFSLKILHKLVSGGGVAFGSFFEKSGIFGSIIFSLQRIRPPFLS